MSEEMEDKIAVGVIALIALIFGGTILFFLSIIALALFSLTITDLAKLMAVIVVIGIVWNRIYRYMMNHGVADKI